VVAALIIPTFILRFTRSAFGVPSGSFVKAHSFLAQRWPRIIRKENPDTKEQRYRTAAHISRRINEGEKLTFGFTVIVYHVKGLGLDYGKESSTRP